MSVSSFEAQGHLMSLVKIMKVQRKLISIAVGACLLLGCSAYAQKGPTEGKAFPAFAMTTVDGKKLSNTSLKGKVVLIDLWATWCGPCKMASPAMQNLHKKYGSKGLVVIGANTFENEKGPKAASGYMKEHKYTYTFTYNNDAFAQALGVRGIPQFYLVDKSGKLIKSISGYSPDLEKMLDGEIKKLI